MVTISLYWIVAVFVAVIVATAITVTVASIVSKQQRKWPWYAPIRIAIVAVLYGATWPIAIALTVAFATDIRMRDAVRAILDKPTRKEARGTRVTFDG